MDKEKRKRKQYSARTKASKGKQQSRKASSSSSTSSSTSETSSSSPEMREGFTSVFWTENERACGGCGRALRDGDVWMRCDAFPYSHLACAGCYRRRTCCEADERRKRRRRRYSGSKGGGEGECNVVVGDQEEETLSQGRKSQDRPKIWQYFVDMV